MLLRISLIIAIVAGIAAAALNFVQVREVIVTTMNERDSEKAQKEAAQNELASTKSTLKKTEGELATTKSKLQTTEQSLKTMTARATDAEARSANLTTQLERTRAERDAADQKLSRWSDIGLEPEQVRAVIADLKSTREERDAMLEENNILSRRYKALETKYLGLIGDLPTVELPAGLKGSIVAVDPKFDFVVLDIGEQDGVLERGEMLVNRGGKLIAKVRIAAVEPRFSIANILPDWKQDELIEGDQVLY